MNNGKQFNDIPLTKSGRYPTCGHGVAVDQRIEPNYMNGNIVGYSIVADFKKGHTYKVGTKKSPAFQDELLNNLIVSGAPLEWVSFEDMKTSTKRIRNSGRKRLRMAMRIAFNWRQPIPNY